MGAMLFSLIASHSQVAVFYSSFDNPFNYWTQQHSDRVCCAAIGRSGFG